MQNSQSILIVAQIKNYLLISIEKHLTQASYNMITTPADTDAIGEVKEPLCGILLYVEEKLLEQQQALHFIKDRALMDDIPIFALGAPEVLKEVKAIMPAHLLLQTFVRPINVHVSELAEKINSLIKQYNMQKKILVVDDSGSMLRAVKGWLEGRYSVFLANSAAMAIKYLATNRPDLVLLDYEMPVVDGKQVLEMIRTESDFSDIPVMFLTKKDDPESIQNVKELRPEGYLLKTMEPAQIVKAIDDFFEMRKGLL